jgi:hypothetical protein
MQFKTSACVVGIAIAFTLSAASEASAQVTPDRRIPVRKDVPTARVDTVRVTRIDTVRTVVRDTVMVTRWDTVTVAPPVAEIALGNWYFGIQAGSTNPIYNLSIGQAAGYHGGILFGWHPVGSPFGIQFDAAYHRIHELSPSAGLAADPELMHLNGNIKLGIPWARPAGDRAGLYVIGGPSVYYHKNLRWARKNAPNSFFINDVACNPAPGTCPERDDATFTFGWNAGIGLVSGRLLAEAKYQRMLGEGARSFIPLSIGIAF